ncbi:MAG: AAA family ATPase [Gammaproteobacteria bacterium]|nr:AAA family ATPase [Gammaproteobacteria bacterium]
MNTAIRHDLFGLTSCPFILDPKEPFLDEPRSKCLKNLEDFLAYRGFAAIAGRPGVGKTALVRYFIESLHPPSHKIVYMPFTNLSENDILKVLCARLDATPPFRKNAVIEAIQTRIRDLHPIHPVIILDEMQNATPSIMDSIRLLANDHFDAGSKMSCIFVGTTEFFDKLRLAINLSLCQRITLFCRIGELAENDTNEFLAHCLRHAGVEHQIFEPAATKLIYDASGGSIRLIKQIAAGAMIVASEQKTSNIALEHVRSATERCLLPRGEI